MKAALISVSMILLLLIGCSDDDDIICHVDGDDWICDMDALSLINMRYEKSPEIQALWTAQRWGFSNYNISGPLAPDADPYTHPWVSSHMKTFRAVCEDTLFWRP